MKNIKLIFTISLFAVSAFLCQQIIFQSIENQKNKLDYAEVNHIKYGLFSVNKWKENLAKIVADEITKLNLTDANERDLKKHVEIQLNGLIDKVDKKIRATNEKTAGGWVKQAFINTFVDLKDVKEGIPQYADAIIIEMTKVKTETHLKDLLQKRVEKYFDRTFEAKDLTALNQILARTGLPDIETARVKIEEIVKSNQDKIYQQTWILISLAIIIFLIAGYSTITLPPFQYIGLLLTLVVLLATGVTTPMIDMEAKISEMSFTLLDYPITFTNQVLYFQSKSILDVFWIMITHSDIEMKIVGILMVAFSIVFPLFKMFSSMLYYFNYRNARDNWWIQFFVLKSGKWSMTDVLIVAIFMAYIGFNGIITSQFGTLNSQDQELVILTTNGTSLQPGFYIFLTYTMLALFLSEFLIRKPRETT